jgi:hypothetical protein
VLGAVTHTFNLKYLRSGDGEVCGSRPSRAKKLTRLPYSTNKSGMVVHVSNCSYVRDKGRKIKFKAHHQQKKKKSMIAYLKKAG